MLSLLAAQCFLDLTVGQDFARFYNDFYGSLAAAGVAGQALKPSQAFHVEIASIPALTMFENSVDCKMGIEVQHAGGFSFSACWVGATPPSQIMCGFAL